MKFDEPALIAALATDAGYVGALGSRKTQARRNERLLEASLHCEKAKGGRRFGVL